MKNRKLNNYGATTTNSTTHSGKSWTKEKSWKQRKLIAKYSDMLTGTQLMMKTCQPQAERQIQTRPNFGRVCRVLAEPSNELWITGLVHETVDSPSTRVPVVRIDVLHDP